MEVGGGFLACERNWKFAAAATVWINVIRLAAYHRKGEEPHSQKFDFADSAVAHKNPEVMQKLKSCHLKLNTGKFYRTVHCQNNNSSNIKKKGKSVV